MNEIVLHNDIAFALLVNWTNTTWKGYECLELENFEG